jgi:hypothetical protein
MVFTTTSTTNNNNNTISIIIAIFVVVITGGSWHDYPGGTNGPGSAWWGANYTREDGSGFWDNDGFGVGYQQSYGGGPVRGGFGGPGRRPGPYSGMLHLLVMYVEFIISMFHSFDFDMLVAESEVNTMQTHKGGEVYLHAFITLAVGGWFF